MDGLRMWLSNGECINSSCQWKILTNEKETVEKNAGAPSVWKINWLSRRCNKDWISRRFSFVENNWQSKPNTHVFYFI